MNRKQFLNRLIAGGSGLSFLPWLNGCGLQEEEAQPQWDQIGHSWEAVRDLFPLTHDRIYLNTGGLGPASLPVLSAMAEQNRLQAVEGENYHHLLGELREQVARFNGVDSNEIAFTRNATEGNSLIAAGLELKRGDEVIFESEAHPGGSFPWLNRQKRDGIKVRIFEPDLENPAGNLQRIADLATSRTRVIQVSHMTAPTGLLFDIPALAKFARERDIWFHVDGAQTAGMIPVNLRQLGCDSYATSGHKWINGPQGTGYLYIARERVDEVLLSHAGAHSASHYEFPDTFVYLDSTPRHEYGTRNAADIRGLTVAMNLQERIGRERIANHGKNLVKLTRKAYRQIRGIEILTPERDDMHGSILTFRIPGRPCREITHFFRKDHALRVRPVTEQNLNAVRISWHVYHQEQDVEPVIRAARDAASV